MFEFVEPTIVPGLFIPACEFSRKKKSISERGPGPASAIREDARLDKSAQWDWMPRAPNKSRLIRG